MSAKPTSSLTRKAVTISAAMGLLLLVGYFASDRQDYPGKAEFERPNSVITTNSGGTGHGNTAVARGAAARFSATMKSLQAATFTGGTGRTPASGGEFVTYCRQNADSVAFLVHVPELRNYKDEKAREALATLAWTAASQVAREMSFETEPPEVIVALRGFASYGPIWSGKRSGPPQIKTDTSEEVKRLYPFFAPGEGFK